MNDEQNNLPEPVVGDPAQGNQGQPNRWKIGLDTCRRSVAQLPEDQREALVWICQYGLQANISPSDLAARLLKENGQPYSQHSLYAALTGRRTEDSGLEKICAAIRAFRRRTEETSAKLSSSFIETPMTRRIFQVCRRAFVRHRISIIHGPSQVGKTAAVSEYARLHNHGETTLIRMPTGGGVSSLQQELATRFGIAAHQRANELARRIFDCFDERSLLIVDEATQCLHSRSGLRSLEFLRELHDRRNCGVVLVGTDVFLNGIRNNPVLVQLFRRRSPGSIVSLPAIPPAADLDVFADAFGLGPAPDKILRIQFKGSDYSGQEREQTFSVNPKELQDSMIRTEGLGSWVKLLEDARDDSVEAKRKFTWGGVIITYCQAKAAEAYLGKEAL